MNLFGIYFKEIIKDPIFEVRILDPEMSGPSLDRGRGRGFFACVLLYCLYSV